MQKIDIKPMSERHLNEVAELERSCFSQPWSKSMLAGEVDNEDSHFFVAVDDLGQVLGYAGAKFVCDEGYITNVAVFRQHRGNGIAQALLRKLIQAGREKNLKFISLEVRKSNAAAISLYKKLKFAEVGQRKDFYLDPKEDALIMTRFNLEEE